MLEDEEPAAAAVLAWLSEADWLRREPIMKPDARLRIEERVPVLDVLEWVLLRWLASVDMMMAEEREQQGGRDRKVVGK